MYGLGIIKGLIVTMKVFLRKPVTIQYPEQKVAQHARFRGEEFVWYEERCTGCASCAKSCPLGIIKIVTGPDTKGIAEGGFYDIEVFDIDIGRCMFCGLCVEACPYDALFMGSGFEEGQQHREALVIDIDRLRTADKHPSTWFRPQLEARRYDPHKGTGISWDLVGREDWPFHPPGRPIDKPSIENGVEE